MTPKEAAEILKDLQGFHLLVIEQNQALELAIQALEEKQEPEIVPIGTKVRVTKRVYIHFFDIGDILKVITFDNDVPKLPYRCLNKDGMIQWLSREEFEIIEQ